MISEEEKASLAEQYSFRAEGLKNVGKNPCGYIR